MRIMGIDPWRVFLHEKPLQKNLEFFLKNREKILGLPIAVVEYKDHSIVIDGTHRVIASRMLEISKIPAIVFSFPEYKRYIIIKRWYGFTNVPLKLGNLELGEGYVVEVHKNNRWYFVGEITSRQYEILLPFLEFSTRDNMHGMKYRVYLRKEITHEEVVGRAISGKLFPPKTTAHFVEVEGRIYHIEIIEKDEELRNQFMKMINVRRLL